MKFGMGYYGDNVEGDIDLWLYQKLHACEYY